MDQLLAAVDLGSNSFRLSIGRIVQQDGTPRSIRSIVSRNRPAGRRTGHRKAPWRRGHRTRHRGAGTLRRTPAQLPPQPRARGGHEHLPRRPQHPRFPARAEAALGFPIEVIAGREEARLIFRAWSIPCPSPNKRLVIDIGGGSTEVIIGKGHEPTLMSSLYMGCVSYSRQFFRTA